MTTVDAPTIQTLFDPAALQTALDEGYVRRQVHPEFALAILNYSEKAAYDGVWNDITLTCRGLIYNVDTLEIVARPFGKFFNHGQSGAPALDLHAAAVVTDKADGSLGILYPTAAGYAVATRGSFASDQAVHATAVWRTRYADRFTPAPGITYLFEIVYPANRIVLNYGDLDDLVLLGAIDTTTGGDASVEDWPGPRVTRFPYASLAEALAAPPRENAEGLVVYFPGTGHRLKLKQADYVELHKVVTGLNARVVWQHLVDGRPLAELVQPLPDEFHPWVRDIAAAIAAGVAAEYDRLQAVFAAIVRAMPAGWDAADPTRRKDFALVAARHADKWALFRLLDGGDIRSELLRRARPEPFVTPSGRVYTEDTA